MTVEVVHNEELGRFEVADQDGHVVAYADYRIDGTRMVLPHTFVERDRRNEGLAAYVVENALIHARASGRTVVPSCSYVSAYIDRHSEYRDLVEGH